jgi:hypothetical protein
MTSYTAIETIDGSITNVLETPFQTVKTMEEYLLNKKTLAFIIPLETSKESGQIVGYFTMMDIDHANSSRVSEHLMLRLSAENYNNLKTGNLYVKKIPAYKTVSRQKRRYDELTIENIGLYSTPEGSMIAYVSKYR